MTIEQVLQYLYHQAAKGTTLFQWMCWWIITFIHQVIHTSLCHSDSFESDLTGQVSIYHEILHYSFRKISSYIKMSLNLSSLFNRFDFPRNIWDCVFVSFFLLKTHFRFNSTCVTEVFLSGEFLRVNKCICMWVRLKVCLNACGSHV